MMKRFLILGTALVFLAFPVQAEDMVEGSQTLGIQASGLYSFATASMQKNGVIGGELENITGNDLVIVRAESDVAERVELHIHLHEDGVMKMREVPSYAVPARDFLILGAGAEHIMLMGLKKPLEKGSVFSVRFYDESGASIEAPVMVQAPGYFPEPQEVHGMCGCAEEDEADVHEH